MAVDINRLLKILAEKNASDLHITANSTPKIRVDEQLVEADAKTLSPAETKELAYSMLSKEQIALFVVLRPYFSSRRYGLPDDPEAMVAEALRERSEWPGIEHVFADVAAVEAAWQSYFPDGPDWRDVSDQFGLPGFLAEIDGNLARDEHFVRVIIDLVNQRERVFAVAGASHAVKLDAALHAALGSE